MQTQKDTYFVAVKLLLVDDQKRLLIIKDIFDDGWDLPGGRLRKMDFDVRMEDVVKRKMDEEIGSDVRYELGEPIVFFRHERMESTGEQVRIFAVGYQAKYLGGNIKLGEYMKEFKWFSIDSLVPEEYLRGGWLKGVKEFQEKFKKNHGANA